MAYYCLECFNKIEHMNLTYKDVECDMDFCENCGKNLPCVAFIKNNEINNKISDK